MRFRRTDSPLGAGARDKWVTIQGQPTEEGADSGFPIETWTDLATVAMAREDVAAVEIERAAQQMAVSTTRWEMAYRPDMDPERVDVPKLRRLVYLGRDYDIVSATPVGRQRVIEIITEAHAKTPTEAP